ncbi:MAG: hypothetical protein K0S44_2272 [Bacteroidetes bacterium]|jgi:hypothetical protein|nr:hypothetical protein [Bacteroidota bacterium]
MRKQSEQQSMPPVIFQEPEPSIKYICYASELIERLSVTEEDLDAAIERAFKACSSLNISIKQNFKSVFRTCEDHLVTDWRLSPLACYLIVINADPSNEQVARMQIHFATKNYNDVSIF